MNRDFEFDIFRFGLISCALYQILQFVRDLITQAPAINMFINLFSIVVIVLMFGLTFVLFSYDVILDQLLKAIGVVS